MGNWRTSWVLRLLFVLAATMCCGAALSLVRGNVPGRLYNEIVLDNYDHFLPCEELPRAAEVDRIVEEHEDVTRAIQDVNPGHIFVEVDYSSCPGRADIVISYATHQDRLAIEEIIGGHSFFGVPCRFRNI
jgi:hypothetical protein